MTATRIKEALHKTPFRPFELVQDGVRAVRVQHPDCLMFAAANTVCVVAEGRDSLQILELNHVSGLSYTPFKGRSAKNGSSKKKRKKD